MMKAAEEIKDVTVVDFSNNGLVDIGTLNNLTLLTKLNLSNNRIKIMSIF